MNDYISGRQDGLLLAERIVEESGLEGLREEIKYRNTYKSDQKRSGEGNNED